jgi:hypothetical protein
MDEWKEGAQIAMKSQWYAKRSTQYEMGFSSDDGDRSIYSIAGGSGGRGEHVGISNFVDPQRWTVGGVVQSLDKSHGETQVRFFKDGILLDESDAIPGDSRNVSHPMAMLTNFKGEIAEILIYGSALSLPQLQALNGYFSEKYSLRFQDTLGHQLGPEFETEARQIEFERWRQNFRDRFDFAIRSENLDEAARLVPKLDVMDVRAKISGTPGWTPLLLACHRGHERLIRAILSKNASLDVIDDLGNNALDHLILGDHAELIDMVYKVGSMMRITDLLHAYETAVKVGNDEAAEQIRKYGIKPNYRNVRPD